MSYSREHFTEVQNLAMDYLAAINADEKGDPEAAYQLEMGNLEGLLREAIVLRCSENGVEHYDYSLLEEVALEEAAILSNGTYHF